MDIMEDPWIKHLQEIDSPELSKTIMKRDTVSRKSIQALLRTTTNIESELGSWAARCYIHACVTTFLMSYKDYASLEGDTSEKLYLHTILSRMELVEPSIDELSAADAMSPKLLKLIQVLQNEMKPQDTSGIVFVKTRAEYSYYLLSLPDFPLPKICSELLHLSEAQTTGSKEARSVSF